MSTIEEQLNAMIDLSQLHTEIGFTDYNLIGAIIATNWNTAVKILKALTHCINYPDGCVSCIEMPDCIERDAFRLIAQMEGTDA